jgi:hypothetical protein
MRRISRNTGPVLPGLERCSACLIIHAMNYVILALPPVLALVAASRFDRLALEGGSNGVLFRFMLFRYYIYWILSSC